MAFPDAITTALNQSYRGKSDDLHTLHQALVNRWSIAAAADIKIGEPASRPLFTGSDPEVLWIMSENLLLKSLERADPNWVANWKML